MLSLRSYLLTLGVVLALLTLMKGVVDVCLPQYPDSVKVFRMRDRPSAQICDALLKWDFWARENQHYAQAKLGAFDNAPGLMDAEDGQPAYILFGKDLAKLTVLLARIPGNRLALVQVSFLAIVSSFLICLFLVWMEGMFSRKLVPKNTKAIKERRRVEEKAHQTLIQSRDTIESQKKARRPDPDE